ncbi:hypothetical protein HK097_007112 [Rhizophlyctis rosea]|uniref:Uncharacterized protein n=1 Tax=Rhizophlyctis rosea TaxID=64517 RepID=A0AAD5SKJ0_9FUNG|nr:hypothetical protein HK097_007112 [Rhizophlyctis rosea]
MTTILITGCTVGGLGFEAATQILQADSDATLLLTVRSEAAQRNVIDTLHAQNVSYPSRVTVKLLDLSSLASVRSFCDELDKSNIQTILCNAGTIKNTYRLTEDGHEWQFQVNYLAHFLLIYTLLPTLLHRLNPKIVLVSSDMHLNFMNTDPSYLHHITPVSSYNGMTVYGHTKYLENALAQYLVAHLPIYITINTVTPGLVPSTAMADKSSCFDRVLARHVLPFFGIAVSKEIGAKRLVEVAVAESAAGVTGKYWSRGKFGLPRQEALDQGVQEKLWKLSCDLVGVDASPSFLE